jgi:peptide/nickel transport system substrate-binding protein
VDAFADGAAGSAIRPIGAGPYRVRSFESNVRMIADRFDEHWGGTTGRPAAFEHHYVPDGRARLNAVRSGQATVALLDSRQVTEARSAGLTVQANEKNAFWVLYFNKSRAHADDPRVRQAFMHAIDREALADALTFGTSQPARQLFAASSPLHVDSLDNIYKFDPNRARALLAEAGLKDGIDLSMLLLNNTEFRPLAEALQAMLGDVGIRLKFDPVDVSQYTAFFLPPPRGDMMLGRYGGRADPVQMLFELVGDGGPFSPGGSVAPALDQLIQKSKTMAATDPARTETLRTLAVAISEQAALVPIMTRSNVYAYKPGCVTRLTPYLPGGADRFNDVRVGPKCR